MFNLVYNNIDWLPKLAWCAQIRKGDPKIAVDHGPWVETNANAFFEGAWAGNFNSFDFANSEACLGTGGKVSDTGIVFATPTHTCDRLQLIRLEDQLLISNSLPFLLVKTNDTYREHYPFYHHDFYSIIDGLDKYVRKVPTKNNRYIDLFYHCNVHINNDLSISERPKKDPPPFSNYHEYVGFLKSTVSRIAANAQDSNRSILYSPLTSISTGYDSPASSVLAREVGCREAITFVESRTEFPQRDDSGKRIGEKLGLVVSEFDSNAYKLKDTMPEAEFLANGTGGEDVIMSRLEDVLPRRVFFVGFHGGVWHKHKPIVSSRIPRGDGTGNSLAEFRLRVGFILFPVPFLGCTRQASIHAISNSKEMEPWSLNQEGPFRKGYDRPIPRRLVEEAGIPRQWFGQSKKAITRQMVFWPRYPHLFKKRLDQVLSQESMKEFGRFLESKKLKFKWTQYPYFSIMRFLYRVNRSVIWRTRRLVGNSRPVEESRFFFFHWRYQHSISEHMFLFHWGLERTMNRYKKVA